MKRLIVMLLVIALLITGCSEFAHTQPTYDSPSAMDRSDISREVKTEPDESFVCREDDQLQVNGITFRLQAVNFDNLVWYQETQQDGVPMYLLHHTEKDYDWIQSLGFNAIRHFIRWQDLFTDPDTCEKNTEGWKWLDQNITWAKERGIYLILDFHNPCGAFGTQGDGTWPIWTDETAKISFLKMWKIIAETYSDEPSIAAYDLMNEPTLQSDGVAQYKELLESVISTIRQEDLNHVIIVEAATGVEGNPESFTRPTWVEVSDENVMYSFHFYEPIHFSHQDRESQWDEIRYPNDSFSQDDLQTVFENFINEPFLKEYPLFLGEFGCNDWSENSGSEEWIEDMYRICEDRNIHTAFFVYRSFENQPEKDDYSFAISQMYTQADTLSGTEEVYNDKLLNILLEVLEDKDNNDANANAE